MGLIVLELASQYHSLFQSYQLLCFHYIFQTGKQVISVFIMFNPCYQVVKFLSEIKKPKWLFLEKCFPKRLKKI